MVVVGADGYPGGWVLYSINVQSFATQVEVTHDLASLLRSHPPDMAALGIDVPIGLLDRPRACDLAARKLLGVRGCCVFPAPSRAAVYAEHYRQASDLNQERTGRRLSKQSWGIVPKIRQVDEAMSTESQTWAFEVHPEVSFWKLNQHHPMRYRKKSKEGRSERVTLLRSICDGVDRQLERLPRGVRMDDLLDAAVSAWSALRWWRGEACSVADPERDAMGLPVAIHY
jgi:predicted RNase H-like nuclease